ncbi:hypothetical protein [Kineococcus aurantiacus]|uniref:Uncharacterized protein n=1 Tax=Kineococcus aurantiacus TaxID=37633 RepID=A0A7Y9DN63_9ACTN|nr:hypothetical protein [Kineococcus aurantiacus]NYD23536.1 hypothetical protein [Kineococcus aurantiacus]
MRWDDLFDDLEAQADHERRQDLAAEVADRVRREEATVRLGDRVRAAEGPVTFVLPDGVGVTGTVATTGPGWFLVVEVGSGRRELVHELAVVLVHGAPARSAAPLGEVAARRTFLLAVRALAGRGVRVRTSAGSFTGVITRVGADHLDLEDDRGVRTVPFAAVWTVGERG